MNNWFVYILECRDKTYYTGITNHLEERLKKHQNGKASIYTRDRGPVKLVYSKGGYNQSDARREEIILKDWRREKKEKLVRDEIER